MNSFINVMKAVREPNRVKILKILQHGELCVCEIQAALALSQGCTSKHLDVLVKADLVKRSKKGLWVYFRLTDDPRSPYAACLLGNLRQWLDNDAEVAETVAKLPEIRRRHLCTAERPKDVLDGNSH